MGMVVLDGSESWWLEGTDLNSISGIYMNMQSSTVGHQAKAESPITCDKLPNIPMSAANPQKAPGVQFVKSPIGQLRLVPYKNFGTLENGRQWLQANPTTVVYELAEPYYEDITNLQSAPTLKTYLECSVEIDTDLPIDTNVTYRTNLSSVYVMERELDELDNGTDLGDILEGEVNE